MAIISGTTLLVEIINQDVNANSIYIVETPKKILSMNSPLVTVASKEVGGSTTDLTRQIVQYWG